MTIEIDDTGSSPEPRSRAGPGLPAGPRHACGPGDCMIRCHALSVGWGGRAVLPPVDVTIRHGELWSVVGRNGAGKTTWFRTVLGLLPPVSGRVETCVDPLPMAYIPQRLRLDPIVPLLVRDVVAMGLLRGRGYLRPAAGSGGRRRVLRALEETEALELADLAFRTLSEGQKQRVLMARLLCSEPELAVLDEPTAAMDEVAERETLCLLDRLRREHGLTVLMVTHHLPAASRFADRVIFFDRELGSVVAGRPAEVLAHPAFLARYGQEPLGGGSVHAT